MRVTDDLFAAGRECPCSMCHVTAGMWQADSDAPFDVDHLAMGVAVEGLARLLAVQRLVVLDLELLVEAVVSVHGCRRYGNIAVTASGAQDQGYGDAQLRPLHLDGAASQQQTDLRPPEVWRQLGAQPPTAQYSTVTFLTGAFLLLLDGRSRFSISPPPAL